MTGGQSNKIHDLLAGKKEYDPFTQTQTISMDFNFAWGLKVPGGTNTYVGELRRVTQTGDDLSDETVFRVLAETDPTGSAEKAKHAGQGLMLSKIVIIADDQTISLDNKNVQTADVSVVMGNLYKMDWEGQFVFENGEQVRAVAFARNLEIRAYSVIGYMDLDDEDENFIHRGFKLFYNHAYDEDAFSSELEELYSEQVKDLASNFIKAQGSPCFIATAAYGTTEHADLDVFRWVRDAFLNKSPAGRKFVRSYYKWGPKVANKIGGRRYVRSLLRASLQVVAWVIRIGYQR